MSQTEGPPSSTPLHPTTTRSVLWNGGRGTANLSVRTHQLSPGWGYLLLPRADHTLCQLFCSLRLKLRDQAGAPSGHIYRFPCIHSSLLHVCGGLVGAWLFHSFSSFFYMRIVLPLRASIKNIGKHKRDRQFVRHLYKLVNLLWYSLILVLII